MKAKRVKKLKPHRSLAENAARIVRVRLKELRSLAAEARAPGAAKAQHDARIAAKRLRYVLETTEECFGEAGAEGRRRARDVQGALGDLHDCDVMLPRVERHVAERGDGGDRGLRALAEDLTARRDRLHTGFRALWEEIDSDGTWARLEKSAQAVLDDARATVP
jgi:CHAD domain-containing protein